MVRKKVLLNEKVAKKLFKNEKYGKMLSARLISDVLDADYEEVLKSIKPSTEEIALSALTVNSTADVIYQSDVMYVNIELNFYNTKSKIRQLQSYIFQIFLGQLHTYKNYNKMKKIVQISIDAFDMFNMGEFMYRVSLMEEKHKIPYNDLIQIVHVNLDYLRKIKYNELIKEENKLMRDLYFMMCDDKMELKSVYERDDLMKKIVKEATQIAGYEKMDLYISDEEMRRQDEEFAFEQGLEQGLVQGLERGINEGKFQEKREMIVNFYKNGVSLGLISKSSGLSIEEVQNIISKSDDWVVLC